MNCRRSTVRWVGAGLAPWLLMWLDGSSLLALPPHHANVVWQELQRASPIPGHAKALLPEFYLPDGLSADTVQSKLEKLVAEDLPLDEFLRSSQLAPQIIRLADLEDENSQPLKRLDVFFTATGDLSQLAGKRELTDLVASDSEVSQAQEIPPEALKRLGIAVAGDRSSDDAGEAYGYAVSNVLDRIELKTASRSFATQSGESIILAGYVDPRFRDDVEFPNTWKRMPRGDDEDEDAATSHSYPGAIYSLKVTQLPGRKHKLFVEGHVLFVEPTAWFDGANLLRSKLPPVVQSLVRRFRRELAMNQRKQ